MRAQHPLHLQEVHLYVSLIHRDLYSGYAAVAAGGAVLCLLRLAVARGGISRSRMVAGAFIRQSVSGTNYSRAPIHTASGRWRERVDPILEADLQKNLSSTTRCK